MDRRASSVVRMPAEPISPIIPMSPPPPPQPLRQNTFSSAGDYAPGGKLKRKEAWTFWLLFWGSIAGGVALAYGLLGPIYATKPFQNTLPQGYGSGIYLLGVVESLDLSSRLLEIQWLIHSCEETGQYKGCNALLNATNFFVDAAATMSATLDPATASLVYKPNLQGYITDGTCIGQSDCWNDQLRRGVPYEQTLRTMHRFSIRPSAWNWRSNAQAYPFDTYDIYTTFLAMDPINNVSRPILGATLTGTIPNFGVRVKSRPVVIEGVPLQWRTISMTVHRSEVVLGFAFLIWTVNWLVTGVVLWITISSVQGKRKIPADLFAVPISALFALPTVRQAMPSSPEFGSILDYSGIILNVAIVSFCSVALLLVVIARDGKERYESEHRHKQFEEAPIATGFFRRFTLSRRQTSATAVSTTTNDGKIAKEV